MAQRVPPILATCQGSSTAPPNLVTMVGKPTAEVPDTDGSITITIDAATYRPTESGDWLLELTAQMQNSTSQSRYLAWYYFDGVDVARRAFKPACADAAPGPTAPGGVIDIVVGFIVTCRPDSSVAADLQSSTTSERASPADHP